MVAKTLPLQMSTPWKSGREKRGNVQEQGPQCLLLQQMVDAWKMRLKLTERVEGYLPDSCGTLKCLPGVEVGLGATQGMVVPMVAVRIPETPDYPG